MMFFLEQISVLKVHAQSKSPSKKSIIPNISRTLSKGALTKILQAVLAYFNAQDNHWTVIYIPSTEIAENGDVRPTNDTTLTFLISTPIAKKMSVRYVDPENPERELRLPD